MNEEEPEPAKPVRHKVVAYISRLPDELLVFEHTAEFPTAGVQVPAGGVAAGEAPATAVVREVREETGLTLDNPIYLETRNRLVISQSVILHYFWLRAPDDTPERWEHRVRGEGVDAGMLFLARFAPMARHGLITGHGLELGLERLNEILCS